MNTDWSTDTDLKDGDSSKSKSNKENEAFQKRDRWDSYGNWMFVMAGCCSTVGISNFLAFPSHCANHGGLQVFLIPYTFFLVFLILPKMTLITGLGQKFSTANPWSRINVRLAGLGFATAYLAFSLSMTYSLFISWELFYAFKSLGKLPWVDARQLDISPNDSPPQVRFKLSKMYNC